MPGKRSARKFRSATARAASRPTKLGRSRLNSASGCRMILHISSATCRTRAESFFPGRSSTSEGMTRSIEWVLRGIEVDVESNHVWLERWGRKPDALSAALDIVTQDFQTWPRLLPIYGHRFLAAEPRLS